MADYNMGPFRPRPCGEYSSTKRYRFLDFVTYDGSSYICINEDTIDGDACIGIPPIGFDNSELYWQLMASKGDQGSTGNITGEYRSFIPVLDGVWDYSRSDKITIPSSVGTNTLQINNVYNGCCGIILTKKDLVLPSNSHYPIDFYYASPGANQYYMYTFVYGSLVVGGDNKFIWNRTVINNE